MINLEYIFAGVMVVLLLGLAGYFGWRQVLALRDLKHMGELPAEDRRFHRLQAWRRMVSCVLMVVLAVLWLGSYLMGQEQQARDLGKPDAVARDDSGKAAPNAEQKSFLNRYTAFWLVFALIFMLWVWLAFFDLWAIRRFGIRHYRQIQADRRAMVERQLAIIRSQRNGHK